MNIVVSPFLNMRPKCVMRGVSSQKFFFIEVLLSMKVQSRAFIIVTMKGIFKILDGVEGIWY